jgi:hypothetical protein
MAIIKAFIIQRGSLVNCNRFCKHELKINYYLLLIRLVFSNFLLTTQAHFLDAKRYVFAILYPSRVPFLLLLLQFYQA